MLTRKVSVYSITVIDALTLTAQPPSSSSHSPLPPLPSVIHTMTLRYIIETTTTVTTTIQSGAPKQMAPAELATMSLRKGPNT